MARSVLSDLPANQTYRDLERGVYLQCWWHVRRTGEDFDEALSAANLAFARAYNKFDPDRGVSFHTYAWKAVSNELRRDRSNRLRTNTLDQPTEKGKPQSVSIPDRQQSGIMRLLSEVGEDARIIISLVIEAPAELKILNGSASPERWRKTLWDRLRGIGWSMGRVSVAFDEIREALT